MPAKPVKAKEQYRLVMECRSSGLTDHQWCREKGICPGTFYGWVRRLRQKGYRLRLHGYEAFHRRPLRDRAGEAPHGSPPQRPVPFLREAL